MNNHVRQSAEKHKRTIKLSNLATGSQRIAIFLSILVFASSIAMTQGLGKAFAAGLVLANPQLISVNMDGLPSNNLPGNGGDGGGTYMTPDGRFVGFGSIASDLVPGISSQEFEYYVYDRQLQKMELLSQTTDGTPMVNVDAVSVPPVLSDDGRFAVFETFGQTGKNASPGHLYLRDRAAGTTTDITPSSVKIGGGFLGTDLSSNGDMRVMSGDGTIIVFVAHDATTGALGTYIYNRVTGSTTVLPSYTAPQVSEDGSTVYMIQSGIGPGSDFVYKYDVASGNMSTILNAGATINPPLVSHDGNVVIYDLYNVPTPQLYMANLQTGQTAELSGIIGGPVSLSDDNRYLAYSNGNDGTFNIADLLNRNSFSAPIEDGMGFNQLSADGSQVAYSPAFTGQVYVYQIQETASPPAAPTNLSASSPTQAPVLAWDQVAGATSYNIYRNGTEVDNSTTNSYTDSTAPEGTDIYSVTAVNDAGESSASNSVSVLVDRTAPSITYTVSPSPNSSGWNSGPVTVSFSCTDNTGGSGVAFCSAPQSESGDGSYTLSGTATDNAGNTSSVDVTVNIDATAPTLGTPSWSANPIQVGTNTTLTAPVSDNLSGVSGGEYFIGSDPGTGNGIPMTLNNGSLTATFGSNLVPGVYDVGVRVEDQAGNWSPVSTTIIVIYDNSSTLGITGKNKKDLTPSLANGDTMPGLTSSTQTDTADYGMTVQYKNGSLDTHNGFSFNYSTGTNCGSPNASNCHTFNLVATSFDWLTTGGANNSQGWFQGTANVTVDGVSTTNKFWVTGIDGGRLSPTSNNYLQLRVYAPGYDPSSASPIYQASGQMASPSSVKIQ